MWFVATAVCILLVSINTVSLPLPANTTLHVLDPESVVRDLQRKVEVSRRRSLSSSAEACLTGNPIDDCWRCGSKWASDRQRLADCGIGFGREALGGKGGEIYVVTDSSDSNSENPKEGTLRYAVVQEDPLWITFAAPMSIHLSDELIVNSFKTIDGRGVEVRITRHGCITLQYVSNVIIHNVEIQNCVPSKKGDDVRSTPTHAGVRGKSDGDGISIYGSRKIWIDHCTLSSCADGLIDAIMGSTGITISNNYFYHHNDVMLLGHSDDYMPDKSMQITVAFNRFGPNLVQRMPRCRLGYIHIVNNDFTEWGKYAIGGSANPTIYSQGNRFVAPENPNAKEVTKRVDSGGKKEWEKWDWRSEGDVMVNGAVFISSGDKASGLIYEKTAERVEPKSVGLIDKLTMNSGVMGVGHKNGNGGLHEPSDDSVVVYGEGSLGMIFRGGRYTGYATSLTTHWTLHILCILVWVGSGLFEFKMY
ncbi:Pectate lyase-like protein 1 [Zostera marina]|uniref:Pectate lyase n=1 Tax=Zostera marina TaxID=29655 RepID=A0A0K9P3R8_ZOSMR|nr:Pectate lyase-like protein 1 [Zostera marina]